MPGLSILGIKREGDRGRQGIAWNTILRTSPDQLGPPKYMLTESIVVRIGRSGEHVLQTKYMSGREHKSLEESEI
jgi:hypothetical protein